MQRQKGKGVKIKHNKQQNKKLVVILHIYGTHIHTHTYTQRDYGQFLSLGGGILLEIQQFSEKIVHFCVAKSTLHLHVLHDLERDGLERSQAQEKL